MGRCLYLYSADFTINIHNIGADRSDRALYKVFGKMPLAEIEKNQLIKTQIENTFYSPNDNFYKSFYGIRHTKLVHGQESSPDSTLPIIYKRSVTLTLRSLKAVLMVLYNTLDQYLIAVYM